MEKVLLAGPWVGEFGWELFCWQGFIRMQSRNFDKTIVIGRPGNGALYADFADEYIEFDPDSFKTDAWNCHGAKSPKELVETIEKTRYISGNFDIGMRYTHNGVVDTKGWFFNAQEFHKYTSDEECEDYDVIIHCRNKSTGSDRNFGREQWEKLVEIMPENIKIGCIGNGEAFHIEGTDDLRGVSLDKLIALMGKSKLVVGPSSGPMHMASLCGAKHLVWSNEYNRVRYEKDWNPFRTEVVMYTNGDWNPDPEKIKEIILNEL